MRCEKCRTELSDTAKFCNNCGNPVPITPLCKNFGNKKKVGTEYHEKRDVPYPDLHPIQPPVKDKFPWGKVSFNPFKWNPLGLSRMETYIIFTVSIIMVIIVTIGFSDIQYTIETISERIN